MATIFAKGTIVAVNGQTPGPAPDISYDIDVNYPGVGLVRIDGAKPSNSRRGNTDDDCDIIAATVNTIVDVAIIAGEYHFTIIELDALARCGGSNGDPPPGFMRGPGETFVPLPQGGTQGATGTPGGGLPSGGGGEI